MSSAEQITAPNVDDFAGVLTQLGTEKQSTDLETRQRAGLLAFGRRAGANPDPSILVTDAAKLLAATFESDFCSVGEVVANGTTLMLKVAKTTTAGEPRDSVVHKMSLSAADSMAGAALETAQPVVVDNLPLQRQFADLSLRKLGIVSGLTVPLHVDNRAYGTLGVYQASEHTFTKNDVCFAETIAHLLTNSIARSRSEQRLQNHCKRASTILDGIDSLVIELDAELKLVSLNRACRRVTGFELREIVGKAFSSVFVVPEELDLVQGILRSSAADTSSCEFDSFLLKKDGNRRRIDWSLSVMCHEEGTLQSIVLTGTDRTELIETEQRLEKAETLARESVTRLLELRKELAEQTKTSSRPAPVGAEIADATPEDNARTLARSQSDATPDDASRAQRDQTPIASPSEAASIAANALPQVVLAKQNDVATGNATTPDATTPDAPTNDATTSNAQQAQMIQCPNGAVGPEARTSVRRVFNYRQLIAPMNEGVMPSREEFFQVTCENISAGGFAFYIEDEPGFDHLVVALGQEPTLTFFSARVVRVMQRELEGRPIYLVGCRFSGRVTP